jgi:hypothetical protein
MKGLKGIVVISTIIAAAAALAACDRAYRDASMKQGSGDGWTRASTR